MGVSVSTRSNSVFLPAALEVVNWFGLRTCMAKFQVMNSQTGFRPAKADPTARPQKPDSVIGVSMTRLGPNLSKRPLETYYLYYLLIIEGSR